MKRIMLYIWQIQVGMMSLKDILHKGFSPTDKGSNKHLQNYENWFCYVELGMLVGKVLAEMHSEEILLTEQEGLWTLVDDRKSTNKE